MIRLRARETSSVLSGARSEPVHVGGCRTVTAPNQRATQAYTAGQTHTHTTALRHPHTGWGVAPNDDTSPNRRRGAPEVKRVKNFSGRCGDGS